jgi:uncharacterized protein (DUF1778 family)
MTMDQFGGPTRQQPNEIVNEIRQAVGRWRVQGYPHVTSVTRDLREGLDAPAFDRYRTDIVRIEANPMTVARRARKVDRLELRLEPAQRRLLREAADARAMSVSSFVLTSATEAARTVLADRTHFILPDERWDTFVELLEREERHQPELAAFLKARTVLDDG